MLGGTATKSQIDCPTAAKTGTTSELYDAWLDGYNSQYSTVVWMGYPKRDIAMTDVHGQPQQGGYLPADIWHAYMASVTEGHPCAPLNESNDGLTFKPFYGHYAATGLEEAAKESAKKPGHHKHSATSSPEAPATSETGGGAPPTRTPSGPGATPEANGPTIKQTGGAAPG